MKCISIRQPWAWMIFHAGKDVENRTWPHPYRGPLLIHASKTLRIHEYEQTCWWARNVARYEGEIPNPKEIETGGIIGIVDFVGITVDKESSRWFEGPYGHRYRNPRSLPFEPMRARLSIFESDQHVVKKLKLQ